MNGDLDEATPSHPVPEPLNENTSESKEFTESTDTIKGDTVQDLSRKRTVASPEDILELVSAATTAFETGQYQDSVSYFTRTIRSLPDDEFSKLQYCALYLTALKVGFV